MQTDNCAKCKNNFAVQDLYLLGGRSYCEDCLQSITANLGNESPKPERRIDPTICSGCGKHADYGEYSQVDGVPYCEQCGTNILAAKFPWWMKNTLVVLFILLAFSLYHGRHYINEVRGLYKAERLLRHGKPAEAAEILTPVVEAAPACVRCRWLCSIAFVKAGDTVKAWAVVKDHSYTDDDKEIFDELQGLFNNIEKAGTFIDEAEKLLEDNKLTEARAKLSAARQIYPEWNAYAFIERDIAIGEAFAKKDWDRFLALSIELQKKYPKAPSSKSMVASAFAAKYASTGEEQYRTQSQQALADARKLTPSDAESQRNLAEYTERIEYRLRTREIIDKKEYDRRFRPTTQQEKKTK